MSKESSAVVDVMTELGLDTTNFLANTGQPGCYTNFISIPTYWTIDGVEISRCSTGPGKPTLKKLIRARQLGALYSLQNDLNEQIEKLGGAIGKFD